MFRRRTPMSAHRRWLLQSIVGLVTLPLSALPIWLYASSTPVGQLLWMRARYQVAPPSTPGPDAATAAFARADRKATIAGVPVLLYSLGHPTDSFDGRFVVSRTRFAQQMWALREAGYRPIRVEQLAQYLRTGGSAGLPDKPVLITFDAARTEAMLQADPILAATGMRAAMFVSTADASSGSMFAEQWGSLSAYASGGRWELENSTDDLRVVDRRGSRLVTRLVGSPPDESIPDYSARVAEDIGKAENLIEDHGAGHAIAFAYPYGNWGQHSRAGIARALRRVVAKRFRIAFDQDLQSGWRPAMPGDDPLHIHRLDVMDWTGVQLLQRLDAAAKIGATAYAERGLDHSYTTLRLLRAAKGYRCAGTAGTVLPPAAGAHHEVALSFNDGPSAYTPQVLDLLEHARLHATFFVSGAQLAGRARILTRMLADGDEIGIGTPTPTSTSPALNLASGPRTLAAVRATVRAIHSTVPVTPCLVRPSQRAGAAGLTWAAGRLHERVALWSVDPRDFATTDPAVIARRVLAQAEPGSVITLHDGGSDRWATVQAIPRILAGLARRGLHVTTVTGLYHHVLLPASHQTRRHTT
jgi:peptidoglycan/xylan/chitin deacetylase (PgdA/CDA1 family)